MHFSSQRGNVTLALFLSLNLCHDCRIDNAVPVGKCAALKSSRRNHCLFLVVSFHWGLALAPLMLWQPECGSSSK
jgi:hypothetical protein